MCKLIKLTAVRLHLLASHSSLVAVSLVHSVNAISD